MKNINNIIKFSLFAFVFIPNIAMIKTNSYVNNTNTCNQYKVQKIVDLCIQATK